MTLKSNQLSRKSLVAMLQILQFKRPHNSESEEEFIKQFLLNLPGIQQDECGNLFLKMGDAPEIMYSAQPIVTGKQGLL